MTLPAVFVAFYLCHRIGDYLVQTDWQARHKTGGLGADPVARRALVTHGATYTLSFLPALAWIAAERTVAVALAVAALVLLPHLLVDDGRLVRVYIRRVKGCREPLSAAVTGSVDQTLHLAMLAAVAAVVAA